MTKKEMEELTKMMMRMFNDGVEAVILPEFGKIDERFEKVEENMKKLKTELIESFKAGQQSLSTTIEEVSRKVDEISETKGYGKRLDKLERIVKAN